MNWFLYDIGLCHERVKQLQLILTQLIVMHATLGSPILGFTQVT